MARPKRKGVPKKKKVKAKGPTIFDFFKDMTWDKKNILDHTNENSYSKFMMVRLISMKKEYLPLADVLNKYQGIYDNYQFHALCIGMLPKQRVYEKYIKGVPLLKAVEKQVNEIAEHFKVSPRDAFDYYKIAGEDLVKEIKEMKGGFM